METGKGGREKARIERWEFRKEGEQGSKKEGKEEEQEEGSQ